MTRIPKYACLLGLTAAIGCDGEGETDPSTTDPGAIDVEAIVAQGESYADYRRINAEPRGSQHALGETVNVWVGADAAAAYSALDPDSGSDAPSFAPGTYLFKEHLTAEGDFNGLTIMFKASAGYNPEAADWWWGRTDADYALQDEGKVGYCIACHADADATAYVFGVPTDNRM